MIITCVTKILGLNCLLIFPAWQQQKFLYFVFQKQHGPFLFAYWLSHFTSVTRKEPGVIRGKHIHWRTAFSKLPLLYPVIFFFSKHYLAKTASMLFCFLSYIYIYIFVGTVQRRRRTVLDFSIWVLFTETLHFVDTALHSPSSSTSSPPSTITQRTNWIASTSVRRL